MDVRVTTMSGERSVEVPLHSAAKWLGFLVVAVGGLVLVGWFFSVPRFTTFVDRWPRMVPLTALAEILCGLSLAGLCSKSLNLQRSAQGAALLVLAVSVLRLMKFDLLRRWNLDNLGFPEFVSQDQIAPFTAFSLCLMAAAFLLIRVPGTALLVNGLSLLVLLISCLVFCWYLYGGQPLVSQAVVALPTAVCLTLLAIGILCLRPDQGLTALLTEKSAGGTLMRWLLIPVVIVPLATGWIRLKAQQAGWVGTEAGVSLIALSTMTLFGALVLITARVLSLSERQQNRALEGNRRLAAIVRSSDDAIISKSLEGIITSWNPAAERLFGYSYEEVIGKPLLILFPAERVDEERQILDRISRGETVEHYETVRVRKSGERCDISATISPIRDEAGNVIGASKIARDITKRKAAERALVLFRTLLDNSNDGIEVIDPKTCRFLDVNQTTCLRLGFTRQEMLSSSVLDVNAAGLTREAWEQTMSELRQTGSRVLEGMHRRKDGSTFPVEINARYIHAENDYLIAIVRDTTERKQAEAFLRQTQQQLQSLIEQAPISIAMFDREMRYLIASKQWISSFGRGHRDLAGLSHYELHPDLPHRWMEAHRRGLAGERMTDEEDEWTRPDGTRQWLRWALHPWRGPANEIGGVIIWTDDITERKLAVENLQRSEEKFRQLAENIQEVFWITDTAKHRMEYVSPAYEKIWGRTCESLYAAPLTWIDAIHPEDRDRVLVAAREQQAEGTYDMEYRILRPDKAIRWIHDRAFPIRGEDGSVSRIVGTAEDITQRKRIEEQFRQVQKMEGIGQLAGGVAHDFNNILAVIQMQSELLRMGLAQSQVADEISATVQRAAALTRQLLLFSRQQVFQPSDMDLSESVASTTRMLKRILGETIKMQVRLASQPLFVHADPGMLDQILLNLVVNARDAMINGGQLIVETAAVEFDELAVLQSPQNRLGSFVSLSVSDTGTGIPPEVLPKIFEPFFTTKGVGKGTGLGLATVFGIVQQHQGWVNVYSELGQGTTFRIYLPRLQTPAGQQPTRTAATPLPRGDEMLLLVEDDSSLRASVKHALSQLGYRVLEASTGRKAIEAWNSNKTEIRLVLTDLVMPDGMTGKELGERLVADNPRLKVVYMSGYSAEVIGKDFTLQEGTNFLTKPFEASKLAHTIRKNLSEAE